MTDGRAAGDDMRRRRAPPGSGLLRLYPAAWRERYESEMVATLEQLGLGLGLRGRLDLGRGAIDARLHAPSRLPAAAAFLAGGLWTFTGAGVVAQPTPPDWPGYLLETLPIALVAVIAGAIAIVGCWAGRSDELGRRGVLAVSLAVAGQIAWLVALAAALAGLWYGPPTVVAQDSAVVGTLLVGIVIVRAGDGRLGGLLAIGASLMVFAWPVAWLAFGLAWTLVGALLLARFEPDRLPPTRFA